MSGIDQVHHFHNAAVAPGVTEQPLLFECQNEQLIGIVSHAQSPSDCGVLIVVGGPQYRAGSHRQFVLLARQIASAGYTSLRFDYRGMGDATGSARDFRDVGADIEAAAQAFCNAAPHLKRIVLLGLCDAASAALMFGGTLSQVAGMVLINPWVRNDVSLARAQVKHYYAGKLVDLSFWRKLLGGGVDFRAAGGGFLERFRTALAGRRHRIAPNERFQDAMAQGLRRFKQPVLLILSGKDLTAQEFRDYTASSAAWRGTLDTPNVMRIDIHDADHTFSRQQWRTQVEIALRDWLKTHYTPAPTSVQERVA